MESCGIEMSRPYDGGDRPEVPAWRPTHDMRRQDPPSLGTSLAFGVAIVSLLLGASEGAEEQDRADPTGIEFFERRIRPILIEHCLECHGEDPGVVKGDLDLSTAAGVLAGGDSGPSVVPGDPKASPLYLAVTYADKEFAMPPRGRMPAEAIEDLRRWIEMGAPDPRTEVATATEIESDPWRDPRGQGREHWAYRPMGIVDPPAVDEEGWCRTEIDRLVLARLESAGIEPAPTADRRTLARRAYFDLIGLPPTPEEMDAFLADDRPDAWERLIETLLASPHYGERWGRHWLDVARYADSNGLDENTAFGNAWRYRDWVVKAFNQDLPFDRFVRMQVAGDLLPEPADRDEAIQNLVATGFLSLGPKVLAEPDKEKMLIDIVDEQVDVVGKTFLAQTLGCARCHDHKFDPIPAADYHAMAGILISTRTMENLNTVARVRERRLAPRAEIAAAEAHAAAVAKNQEIRNSVESEAGRSLGRRWAAQTAIAMIAATELDRTPAVFEAEAFADSNLGVNFDQWGSGVGVIHTVRPNETQFAEYDIDAEAGGRWRIRARYAAGESRPIRVLVDGEVIAEAFCGESTGSFEVEALRWSTIEVDLPAGANRIRFERAGAFPHLDRLVFVSQPDLTAFVEEVETVATEHGIAPPLLRRWAEALAGESMFDSWRRFAAIPEADWTNRVGEVVADLQFTYALEAKSNDGISVRSGVTPAETPFVRSIVAGGNPPSLASVADRWQAAGMLVLDTWDRHLASAEGEAAKRLPDPAQDRLREALIGVNGVLRVGPEVIDHYPVAVQDRIAELEAEEKRLAASKPRAIETGIVVEEAEPRDLPIFIRGDHTNQEDTPVPRGYLTVLEGRAVAPKIPSASSGRLELANWMTDPEHPLTARTIVNRVWAWHFGEGIVSTPSNFGLRGGRPTHPELLDWLARRFVADGWSVKELHRRIMNSAVYRTSGRPDPHAIAADPGNELLWRRTPRRLEAELVRDAILEVGGSLDRMIGGSLLRTGNFGYVTNDQSRSNERYVANRRGIYMPVIRNDMYELFATFDYTDPSVSFDRRPSTVVAQQSLFMMNSPLVASQAERLARRLLEDESAVDDSDRIRLAYEICFARPALAGEIDRAEAFVRRLESEAGESVSIAWPPGDSMEQATSPISARLHAWRSLCKVLIASNEFIYIR